MDSRSGHCTGDLGYGRHRESRTERVHADTRLQEAPLVVTAQGGFFSVKYQYLVSYKGLAFHTKSQIPLTLPSGIEIVTAKSIWVPG